MAKQTPETLAADLARRGGPKRPSMDERAAAARRVQANPGKPITYNDQQMRALSAGRTGANNYRQSAPDRPAPIVPPAAPSRPITYPAGTGTQPAFDVSFTPPPLPISTYQASQIYRPMTPTTAPGGMPGVSMPPQMGARPSMDTMPPPPSGQPTSMQTMTQLIQILAKLSDWGGNDQRMTDNPRTWLPDLWSLSGR